MALDDAFSNRIQDRLSQSFSSQYRSIEPQPNVLDQYSSYTYNISLYFLTPDNYKSMISRQEIILPRNGLLLQSGGAPQGDDIRNQWFPLDYYIDDISIQQLQPGRGSRGANGIVSLNFKITEPNGITFLDNLYYAVDQILSADAPAGRKENYAAQTYLMHIKFFGYDQQGNLVKATNRPSGDVVTDSRAIVEKFIPFRFVNITYRIANQLVEYTCSAVVPQNDIGTGQGRGVIPYNVELTASTLSEVFTGTAQVAQATQDNDTGRQTSTSPGGTAAAPPAKANSSGGPGTVVNGLVDALNNYQRELVEEGIYDEFDEFDVIFTDSMFDQATTQPPGPISRSQVGSTIPVTVGTRLLGSQQFVNNESKKISAVAGTTLVQFLDQVIRNSSYIYDQQIQGYDADGNLVQMTGRDVGLVAWYRIGVEVEPKAYDFKRNDYAYKITYRVNPYIINDIRSPYFPETQFRGVHKAYDYWFTGNNTQILNYQQDFNYSYYMVISGPQQPQRLANFREYEKRLYQPRSNESDQGQPNRVNEPAANLAERQYNAADLSRISMTIVGDPAWIHQGEVWRGIAGVRFTLEPFFSDGTINVEVEEPLFQISWNKPSDYDLNTGVTDPSVRSFGGGNRLTTLSGSGTQTYIYRAVSVTSTFSRGRFTQDIEGVLVTFPNLAIRKNLGEEVDSLFVETPNETERLLALAEGITRSNTTQPTETSAGVLDSGTPADRLITRAVTNTLNFFGVGQDRSSDTSDGNLAPARPPAAATSNGEIVGTDPLSNDGSIAESLVEEARVVRGVESRTVFSLLELRRADPVLGREFTTFRQQQQDRIFEERFQSSVDQYQRNLNRSATPQEIERIRVTTRNIAEDQAQRQALSNFREDLLQLGPTVYEEIPPPGATVEQQLVIPQEGNKRQLIRKDD